jgi:hypothetical protein
LKSSIGHRAWSIESGEKGSKRERRERREREDKEAGFTRHIDQQDERDWRCVKKFRPPPTLHLQLVYGDYVWKFYHNIKGFRTRKGAQEITLPGSDLIRLAAYE